MEADKFTVDLGTIRLRVISETAAMRPRLKPDSGWNLNDSYSNEGLLIGQPSTQEAFGTPAWILYESGSIVLRRSRDEAAVLDSAVYHLRALRAAVNSNLLAVSARTFLLPNGSIWLVDPNPIYQLAGFDRRLARRGVTLLPTTIALIDATTGEVVLPEHELDGSVPVGRFSISRMLFRPLLLRPLEPAEPFLTLARAVIRQAEMDLGHSLDQVEQLADPDRGLMEIIDRESIVHQVDQLGATGKS